MTMDVSNRRIEIKTEAGNPNKDEQQVTKPVKRPFDVAFLMLPDEKLKQKQLKASTVYHQEAGKICNNNNDDILEVDDEIPPRKKLQQHVKYLHNSLGRNQVFDDPSTPFKSKSGLNVNPEQKSAFTKVNLTSKDSRMSPNLSISPDLNYQNSLTPSPPIIHRSYQSFSPNLISPNQVFKTQNITAYQNTFIQEGFPGNASHVLDNPFLTKPNTAADLLQPNFAKMRPVLNQYRPEVSYGYPQFQPQDVLKMSQPEIRNPAAAILTTLLPPSLAALSLPAQNVCAKCNVSFRMTSDLVYHMRSHHKNDSVDVGRKRREDKLKCPVCAESFRERHHLTRHMTAHQDKEEDGEPESKKKPFINFASSK